MTITALHQVTPWPLSWPDNKPRVAQRTKAQFNTTRAKSERELVWELQRWRIKEWTLSLAPPYLARQSATDPAVALWWNMPQRRGDATPRLRVLACDRYKDQADNLRAIVLTLTGLRAFERYGTYTPEQAAEGARPFALPPPDGPRPWREILGAVPAGLDKADGLALVNARYRRLAQDAGYASDERRMTDLNLAIEAARKEFGNGG